jgi:DNA-binding Lrp family transcriptional regulator
LKDVELKLICELMKNSRRSDRELARAVGASQPTISRTIKRLEKEGYIREYTIIPDFSKLGFQILTLFLTKLKPQRTPDLTEQTRTKARENESKNPSPLVMAASGMGLGSDRVFVVLSEDYSAYSNQMNTIKQYPIVDTQNNSFLIDLTDETHFMPFTFSHLAKYLEKRQKNQKSKA